jgi:hypothetical protein
VEVHIVADRAPLPPVADEAGQAARRVLRSVGDDRPVVLVIDDIVADAMTRRGG